ncbi:MAG: galactose mutarotase [Clostridia bacterium]|nr:galactose mutarotase [Clostridia bacterium]
MKTLFGTMPDGREVYAYTIESGDLSATVLSYGATLQKLVHKGVDIVCGYDSLDAYRTEGGYHGAIVGRYANRIGGGKITLDSVDYPIARNNGEAHLHGGNVGFDKYLWNIEEDTCKKCGAPKLVCTMTSPDGDEGYPGNLQVKVTYKIVEGALVIDYKATTDKPTYVNLTNHAYFNLHGIANGDNRDHMLTIHCDKVTDVDPKTLLPTGKSLDVTGTAFDFRTEKALGRDHENTGLGIVGYDNNFILNGKVKETVGNHELTVAAVCRTAEREMTILTTMPCMQIYSAIGAGGTPFKGVARRQNMSVAFETQYEPDSPSHGEARLNPGETYHHITAYRLK